MILDSTWETLRVIQNPLDLIASSSGGRAHEPCSTESFHPESKEASVPYSNCDAVATTSIPLSPIFSACDKGRSSCDGFE